MTRHSGESHHRSRLTWEDVTAIRANADNENNAQLARRFGVERSTIRLVLENVTWNDPTYTPKENPFRGSGYKKEHRPPEA